MSSAGQAPQTIDHYEVEHLIGRGAMGAVYAARDRRIGRRVALKTIQLPTNQFADDTAAEDFFRRLQREAEVCGSLQHPNIVTLYEVGYHGSRISYLAMELVEGETLLSMIRRFRPDPVPVETTLRLAADVLKGLSHAHQKDVIHRDIKPANILLTPDGTAKIADFGIARPQNSSLTVAGSLIGTPNYMSPEQVTGQPLSPRTDLFSLGVVLYEMLAATKPFVGDDVPSILRSIQRLEVAPLSDVHPAVSHSLSDFVARLMSKGVQDRPSAAEALDQVGMLRAAGPQADEPTLRLPDRPSLPSRAINWRVVIVALLLLLSLAALPVLWISSRIDSSPTATIPPQKLQEFAEKRRALDQAEQAYQQGRLQESVQMYEAYLAKYPDSITAREGRDRAQAAFLAEQERLVAEQKKSPAPAKRRPRKQEEDISPSELLGRIRRAIRGQ